MSYILPTDGYDSTLLTAAGSTDTTLYVSALPAASTGVLTIFEQDGRTIREKVYYTATGGAGTSASPYYLTVTRGMRLTTSAGAVLFTSDTTLRKVHVARARIALTDSIHYMGVAMAVINGDMEMGGVMKLPSSRSITSPRHVTDKEYVDATSAAAGGVTALYVTQNGADPSLTVNIAAGYIQSGGEIIAFAGAAAQPVTASNTNYVQLDQNGAVVINITGFLDGYIPLAEVVTDGTDITGITDRRPFFSIPYWDKMYTDRYTYGDTIAAIDPLYRDAGTGKLKKALATTAATADTFMGVAIDAGVDTDTGKRVQIGGVVTGLSGLTDGQPVYLTDAGGFSATPGTYRLVVGWALGTTSMELLAPATRITEIAGVNSDASVANLNEALTFFANTAMTGAEATTLRAGATSNADALHTHTSIGMDAGSFSGGSIHLPTYLNDASLALAGGNFGGARLWKRPSTIEFQTGTTVNNLMTARGDGVDAIASAVGEDGLLGTTGTAAPTLGASWTAVFKFRFGVVPATTDGFFLGFAEDADTLDGTGALPTTSRHCGYQYNGANWRITNGDNTTQTTTNVATPGAGWHELKMVRITATSIAFYLDGTLLGTHTTNLPTQGPLLFFMEHVNGAGVTKTIELSRFIDMYVATT